LKYCILMSYGLRKKSLAREVHRVAREELEGALKEALTVTDQDRGIAVHEARKHLKKMRALLRLLQPATGKAFYKLENAAMRKAAQTMSSIRDSHVRVQTIRKLTTRRAPRAFGRIQAALAARLRQATEKAENEDWSKKAASEMEHALCRVDDWPLKRVRTKSLRSGLKAAYKKARCALEVARRDPTDANLHELRKRVKDLWYHLRLLRGKRPVPIAVLIRQLRDLGQKLGDDHDFAMLLAARADNPLPNPVDWEKLEKAVASRRPRLQRAALRLASKTMMRQSGAFADFVVSRWKAWRSLDGKG
jgi:CHAD domain-containing protein